MVEKDGTWAEIGGRSRAVDRERSASVGLKAGILDRGGALGGNSGGDAEAGGEGSAGKVGARAAFQNDELESEVQAGHPECLLIAYLYALTASSYLA